MDPQWLQWAKELQTMAQTGLTYVKDPYDKARYERMQAMSVEMMALQSDTGLPFIKNLFAHEQGHATPKIDVRGAIFREDAILLVKERSDGGWTLPGGWADVGESASEAVAREVYEESGYRVRVTRLLALYDRAKHDYPPHPYYAYKLFFECQPTAEAPSRHQISDTPGYNETEAIEFFRLDSLPPLSRSRITQSQIARIFALHQNPSQAADFD
jgi:ADP-ribose pyrophosphatase YjhB (NUDIX family)